VAGVQAGGTTVVRAAGVTSLADPAPVTEETQFRVASITKPLTATLGALLAGQGLIDLDGPIRSALPRLRLADSTAQETVTPRQLLAHLSGLECEPPHSLVDHGDDDGALDRLVGAYEGVGQLTPPGEIWSYCNTGYWLAGHALATVTGIGATYEDVAEELVLAPLGMTASCFVHDGATPPAAAVGHAPRRPGALEHDPLPGYRFPRSRVPSGGLVSTVPDLLRFAALQLDSSSPHAAALAALREPVTDAVGLRWGTGWGVDEIAGTAVVAHSGSYGGFQTQLTLVPSRGAAVVVLTNSGRGSALARTVVEWVLAEALGLRRREPVEIAVDTAAYEGVYRAQNLEVEIRRLGDRLRGAQRSTLATGETVAPPPLVGVAVARNRFLVEDGEARGAQFDFPGPGRVRLGSRLAVRVS
jgi:CubicO group peptidase (beta-lactamase class C family)